MPTRAEQMVEQLKEWSPEGVTEYKMTQRERMRKVLELRYLNGMTLEEVGKIMGVTRERIRQIEAKAIRMLRANSENRVRALDALAGVDRVRGQ